MTEPKSSPRLMPKPQIAPRPGKLKIPITVTASTSNVPLATRPKVPPKKPVRAEMVTRKPTRVIDMARRFEAVPSTVSVGKYSTNISIRKSNLSNDRRPPPAVARFYCRSVTRKRSSLARKFKSTSDLVLVNSGSGSTGKNTVLCRRISKSRSNPEVVVLSGVSTENSSNPTPNPESDNVTIIRVTSMSSTPQTASEASSVNRVPPPKPPPKPVRVLLAKPLRTLRPVSKPSSSDDPQPSTSAATDMVLRHNERAIDVGDEHPITSESSNWQRSKSNVVRKPSTRPPPPPGVNCKGKSATWHQHQLRQSTSASDIYQSMSSPDEDGPMQPVWAEDLKPSVPSMPPPARPKDTEDDEKFDEVYEDIDVGFNPVYNTTSPAPSETTPTLRTVPYSPKYQKKSQQQRNHSHRHRSRESIYRAYTSADETLTDDMMHQSMFTPSITDQQVKSPPTEKRRSHFGTWGAKRNPFVTATRNTSNAGGGPLELEKLLRIKSEIQLNISKKVDKLKLRVTAPSPGTAKKSSKVRSSLNTNLIYVDPQTLQTDVASPTTSARLREASLYGDDWSTDDEDHSTLRRTTTPHDDEANDDEDPIYGHGGSTSGAYSHSSSGGDSNSIYAIGKSKSASHAANFWKNLDTATTLGRVRSSRVSSARPELPPPPSPPPPPPKSSLLDEIESEYMATEFSRRQASVPESPNADMELVKLSSPPPPPTLRKSRSLASSQLFSSSTDSGHTNGDTSDEDDHEEHLVPGEPLEETLLEQIDAEIEGLAFEDDDEIPSDAGELAKKQAYMSRLPEPQPLYQIYMLHEQEKIGTPHIEVGGSATTSGASSSAGSESAKLARCDEADSLCGSSAEHEDALSLIRRQSSSISTDSGRGGETSSHVTSNTSMRRERLTAASIYGSQRSLWCELQEVRSAGILETLDDNTKKLQEAFFEVITSEASYLRSINVLITHFLAAPEFIGNGVKPAIISPAERKHLFSNIVAVRDCSERLLCDLENRLEEGLILSDVSDILCHHFEQHFEAYVKYCSNQVYQDRTLKRLKALNSNFVTCVTRIEADRRCHGLDMRSFLMLPMQRITRYPLLVYAILERVNPETVAHKNAAKALLLANQVVRNCNEGARRMERTEQLLDIDRRLVYKSADLKRVPLVTSGRYVVKNGQVTEVFERRSKGLLQSKQKTRGLHLFLFSDMLLIAKKGVNGTFVCKDYAARRFVVVEPVEAHSHKVPSGALSVLPGKPHLFVCILLQNAFGRQIEFLFNVDSESDRERWLTAMRPPTCSNPDEKIYAEWDCPQAVAVHSYVAGQDDELELEPGDLINVLRKMPDGWYYGERTRDSKGGWFPSSYVQQVLNDHVRANNYKQRLKVIEAAAIYRAQQQQAEKSALASPTSTTPPSITELVASAAASASSVPTSPGATGQSTTPLMNRLRRLSNPRGYFVNL
uniref:DH domain-containing protein n=1 Tax=Panagrellus redivivus TaxID=6233 RepID=A0A7E4ZZV4_PANRE